MSSSPSQLSLLVKALPGDGRAQDALAQVLDRAARVGLARDADPIEVEVFHLDRAPAGAIAIEAATRRDVLDTGLVEVARRARAGEHGTILAVERAVARAWARLLLRDARAEGRVRLIDARTGKGARSYRAAGNDSHGHSPVPRDSAAWRLRSAMCGIRVPIRLDALGASDEGLALLVELARHDLRVGDGGTWSYERSDTLARSGRLKEAGGCLSSCRRTLRESVQVGHEFDLAAAQVRLLLPLAAALGVDDAAVQLTLVDGWLDETAKRLGVPRAVLKTARISAVMSGGKGLRRDNRPDCEGKLERTIRKAGCIVDDVLPVLRGELAGVCATADAIYAGVSNLIDSGAGALPHGLGSVYGYRGATYLRNAAGASIEVRDRQGNVAKTIGKGGVERPVSRARIIAHVLQGMEVAVVTAFLPHVKPHHVLHDGWLGTTAVTPEMVAAVRASLPWCVEGAVELDQVVDGEKVRVVREVVAEAKSTMATPAEPIEQPERTEDMPATTTTTTTTQDTDDEDGGKRILSVSEAAARNKQRAEDAAAAENNRLTALYQKCLTAYLGHFSESGTEEYRRNHILGECDRIDHVGLAKAVEAVNEARPKVASAVDETRDEVEYLALLAYANVELMLRGGAPTWARMAHGDRARAMVAAAHEQIRGNDLDNWAWDRFRRILKRDVLPQSEEEMARRAAEAEEAAKLRAAAEDEKQQRWEITNVTNLWRLDGPSLARYAWHNGSQHPALLAHPAIRELLLAEFDVEEGELPVPTEQAARHAAHPEFDEVVRRLLAAPRHKPPAKPLPSVAEVMADIAREGRAAEIRAQQEEDKQMRGRPIGAPPASQSADEIAYTRMLARRTASAQ